MGSSWTLVGRSWILLGSPGKLLGRPGEVLGGSWGLLGRSKIDQKIDSKIDPKSSRIWIAQKRSGATPAEVSEHRSQNRSENRSEIESDPGPPKSLWSYACRGFREIDPKIGPKSSRIRDRQKRSGATPADVSALSETQRESDPGNLENYQTRYRYD